MDRPALVTDFARDFGDALPDGGALLGLDLGTKTVGIATCDAGWRYATAGKTLPRSKFSKDCGVLRTLVVERSIAGVVIGLPRNMDGSEGPRAQASRAYARNLAEALDLAQQFGRHHPSGRMRLACFEARAARIADDNHRDVLWREAEVAGNLMVAQEARQQRAALEP